MSRTLARTAAAACIALALSPAASVAADGKRGPGHASYDLALKWHARTAVLDGVERIAFTNTRSKALGSVWLRLWPNGVASCSHPRITIELLSGGSATKRAAACTARKVRLSHDVAAGERAAIRLRFSVDVPPRSGGFGKLAGGPALLGNVVPILAVTDDDGTHLEPYSRAGEAAYSLASSWNVKLDLANGLKAATTGVQTGSSSPSARTRRLRFEAPHARDFELAIGSFHRSAITAGGTRIRLFDTLKPGNAADRLRHDVLAAARDALVGYEQRFGSYGAPELDIVRTDAIEGGLEFPELVFVEMRAKNDGDSMWPVTAGLIAHEIAHQWFYGIVGNNQRREPWLDETFATFASGYPAHECDPGDPWSGFPSKVRLTSSMDLFDAHPEYYFDGLYERGACALHDLRTGLGSQRFAGLVKRWVATHRYRVGTTAELVAAVRAAAPPGFDVDNWLEASRIDVG